jgi:hypothetical protein
MMEIALADFPGSELARALRTSAATRAIPVVALSGFLAWVSAADRELFAALLPKPVDKTTLFNTLARMGLAAPGVASPSVAAPAASASRPPTFQAQNVPAPSTTCSPETAYALCLLLLNALLTRTAAHNWAQRIRAELVDWRSHFLEATHPLWLPFDAGTFLALALAEAEGHQATSAQEPWLNALLRELQYRAGESRGAGQAAQATLSLSGERRGLLLTVWACTTCRQQYLTQADVRAVAATRWARAIVRDWLGQLDPASLTANEARSLLDAAFAPASDAGCTRALAEVTRAAEATGVSFYPTASERLDQFLRNRCPACRHRQDGWLARYWQAAGTGPLIFTPLG